MTRTRRFWDRRTARQRAFLRWAAPLAGSALLALPLWWWHHAQGPTTPEEGRLLLGRVGAVLLLVAALIVVGTRTWSPLVLALTWLSAGVGGVFVRLVWRRGPQPVGEAERDAMQAALEVGVGVALVGIVAWIALLAMGRRRRTGPGTDPCAEQLSAAHARIAALEDENARLRAVVGAGYD
jgi:hypothetical protein